MRRLVLASLFLASLISTPWLGAQETAPPADTSPPATTLAAPEPTPAPAKDEAPPYRPIEGPVIINLPSVDVPKKGTLTILFAHRFQAPVQGSSINDLFTFDSGANIGIGLGYSPFKDFDFEFYRYSNENKTYQYGGTYHVPISGPFGVAVGLGGVARTQSDFPLNNRSTFFAQAILAYTLAPWFRITAEPTYLNHTSGQTAYAVGAIGDPAYMTVAPEPFYANVFNVPVAASIAITRSITVHAEVVPSYGRAVQITPFNCGVPPSNFGPCPAGSGHSSPGVGWIVSVEKSLLRHRWAFTAGNMKETTADQYLLPNFQGKPKNIYVGFYLSRQWGLTN
jgi:hypothetical protein